MTANSMQGDREKCLAVGMDDFISKPVNPNKLQEALKHWLHKCEYKVIPPETENDQ
jgi:two-component system sensor histidine kinase/response regulator